MRTKLSPFVYKVKGNRNYLFFDSLRKQIFNVTPEGTPLELEEKLIENGLVIRTNGIIPFKFKPNTDIFESELILRELQLRITGECVQEKCNGCGEIGRCKKDHLNLSNDIIDNVAKQLINFKIEMITIIGGNPLLKLEMVSYIKSKIKALNYRILYPAFLKNHFKKEQESLEEMGFLFTPSICFTDDIFEDSMSVDVTEFFYNQEFNPCWGNKIAIDANGDIKPCLWAERIYGNLAETHLLNLVINRICDEFWKITKDKIEICQGCEYRYSCPDCRVVAERKNGNLYCKTNGCSYCPEKGEWG